MTLATDIRTVIQEAVADVFEATEITLATNKALIEYSKWNPYKATETMPTLKSSRMLDLSILEDDLLYGYDERSFHPLYGVEYPTGEYPRKFRNFKVYPDGWLEIQVDTAPTSDGEDVDVMYYKVHTEATLPSAHEPLVASLAAALAAKNKPMKFLNEWMASKTKFDNMTSAIEDMENRINQAIADISSGREPLATGNGDDMVDTITNAISDIEIAQGYFSQFDIYEQDTKYMNSAAASLRVALAHLNRSGGFRSISSGELNIAATSLSQAKAYTDHIKLRMSDVNMGEKYESWGTRQEAALQRELSAIGQAVGTTRKWART